MIAISAVDKNWAIGNQGRLLISLPEDQKGVFRKYTSGHTVVYGRKTLETFPGQRLLPNRVNIIMSRSFEYEKEGAMVLHSVDELEDFLSMTADEVYLIGGASLYNSLIELCDKAIITSIHAEFEADCWFPNLDEDPSWELEYEEEPVMSEKGVEFSVRHYRRKA
ncbi:MAG: dihydrofolate reductase [Saccharofermentans sp.]|nr:dihydrofolate reductase [Clostridiales bacterium]MCR4768376.1 dihydrofolate reductase [Saccharofermentans sp.]